VPDLEGYFIRGKSTDVADDPGYSARTAMATGGNSGGAVGSVQGESYKSHVHANTVNVGNETHRHALNNGAGVTNFPRTGSGDGNAADGKGTAITNTDYAATGITVSISNALSGGNETRPKNAYVLYCIKY